MSAQTSTQVAVDKGRAAGSAQDKVQICWVLGVILLVIGGVVAGVTLPGTEEGAFGPEETGSAVGFAISLAVVAVGQILALVGVVATGVRLGINSSRI